LLMCPLILVFAGEVAVAPHAAAWAVTSAGRDIAPASETAPRTRHGTHIDIIVAVPLIS
jgi:hypothetical protein